MDEQIRSFDGTRLLCRAEGDPNGTAIVFSHSLCASLDSWDAQAITFSPLFRVIRHDMRGHGRSEAPSGPYEIEMLARDALSVMDHFQVRRAFFVGLSMGGMVGMWLGAHAKSRLRGLVLANTTPYLGIGDLLKQRIAIARGEGMEKVAGGFLDRWLSPSYKLQNPREVAKLLGEFSRTPVEGFAGACAVLGSADLREALKAISEPTLVITGAEEAPNLMAASEMMTKQISGAEFAIVENAAHLSNLENPDRFNQVVQNFISRNIHASSNS